jgi:hypothetical protein
MIITLPQILTSKETVIMVLDLISGGDIFAVYDEFQVAWKRRYNIEMYPVPRPIEYDLALNRLKDLKYIFRENLSDVWFARSKALYRSLSDIEDDLLI